MGVFDAFQLPYSALARQHDPVIDAAAAVGAGVIIRGGVARGQPGDGRGKAEVWERWAAAGLDDLLDGDTPTQFVLRYTLSLSSMSTTIVGTADVEDLRANLAAVARGPLTADVVEEATRRVSGIPDAS